MAKTATRERPILFSGPMVRAILDGRKTVTRRVVKPQPECDCDGEYWDLFDMPSEQTCPYGRPGDRLWVRETWRYYWDDEIWCCINYRANHARIKPKGLDHDSGHMVAEQCDQSLDDSQPWKPSIHMPRWASRITLEVVDVRVERVQDITEEEAVAEGFYHCCDGADCACDGQMAKGEFADLWDNLNAKRGYPWGSNPFVWVVSFRQLTEGE